MSSVHHVIYWPSWSMPYIYVIQSRCHPFALSASHHGFHSPCHQFTMPSSHLIIHSPCYQFTLTMSSIYHVIQSGSWSMPSINHVIQSPSTDLLTNLIFGLVMFEAILVIDLVLFDSIIILNPVMPKIYFCTSCENFWDLERKHLSF